MAKVIGKLVGVSWSVPERAKATLDKQAAARGVSTSKWIGQVFDMGFAAVCAREKALPVTDADLDAIVGATLLLLARDWDEDAIARGLGVSVQTVRNILTCWETYRRAE